MDEPRLKSKLRVQAMLRQAQSAGCFAAVLRQGDADAGNIVAVLRGREGLVALSQSRDAAARLVWSRGTGPDPVSGPACDAYVAREVSRDPDLWVVEFETADLVPPFG